nr:immunoglobulin heavy chain junction region [Macaca mulatta]MOV40592.1 immunoglobulin heavy chain junction region [Macaca mulatta]MOV41209.1 immunoglobulin heavy chain junction region [Macaca mulatta]MOV44549.1 immunoglobulin heavy chain junction region [Macaca mulatta]
CTRAGIAAADSDFDYW